MDGHCGCYKAMFPSQKGECVIMHKEDGDMRMAQVIVWASVQKTLEPVANRAVIGGRLVCLTQKGVTERCTWTGRVLAA